MRRDSFHPEPSEENIGGASRKRGVNWDKFIYLGLLAILVVLLGRYVIQDYYYVDSDGQIVTGAFNVRFPTDVRVLSYFQEEESDVEQGDRLFRYIQIRDEERLDVAPREAEESPYLKDLTSLQERIAFKEIARSEKKRLLDFYQSEAKRIQKGVELDVYTVDELQAYRKDIAERSAEIKELGQQLALLRGQLRSLRQRESRHMRERFPADTLLQRVFHAPVAGVVSDIFKNESEVALVSERVMSIEMSGEKDLYVKAIFDQEDLRYLEEGDRVTVELSDGRKSLGYVRKLTSTYSDQLVQTKQQYEAMNRNVVAEIYPTRERDRAIWKQFRNMGVHVYKRKL